MMDFGVGSLGGDALIHRCWLLGVPLGALTISTCVYPRYRILVQTVADAKTKREKQFGAHQEGARKAVERVFGVRITRFHLLCKPSRLWYEEDMIDVVKCCRIIHNIVCESRLENYTGMTNIRIGMEEPLPSQLNLVDSRDCTYDQAELWRKHVDPIEDPDEHCEL